MLLRQKILRTGFERRRDLKQNFHRDVLLTALDSADVGEVAIRTTREILLRPRPLFAQRSNSTAEPAEEFFCIHRCMIATTTFKSIDYKSYLDKHQIATSGRK